MRENEKRAERESKGARPSVLRENRVRGRYCGSGKMSRMNRERKRLIARRER